MTLFGKKENNSHIEVTLGIDIGGTLTTFGYIDQKGRCLAHAMIPTQSYQPIEIFFIRLHEAAQALLETISGKYSVSGVGITAPHANYYTGIIDHPPNLSWECINVFAEVDRYYRVPVVTTTHTNAAAITEMLFGAAQGMKNIIIITSSREFGSGIMSGGRLILGADGSAGEIGHTTVDLNGRQCVCGRSGCLETYASPAGVCRTVYELFCKTTEHSELRSLSYEQLSFKMICRAAQHGDRLALEALEYTGKILGLKLADSVAHVSPEAIIFLGGLAAAGDLLFHPAKQSMEEHLFGMYKNKVKLVTSEIEENIAAVLCAGGLSWNSLLVTRKEHSRKHAINE